MKHFLIALLMLAFLGCFAKTVEYEVSGTAASVDITIAGEGGSTEQFADVPPPWSKSIDVDGGDFVYVSAQNQTDRGSVHVEINYEGTFHSETIDEATSEGAYVIATASGSVP